MTAAPEQPPEPESESDAPATPKRKKRTKYQSPKRPKVPITPVKKRPRVAMSPKKLLEQPTEPVESGLETIPETDVETLLSAAPPATAKATVTSPGLQIHDVSPATILETRPTVSIDKRTKSYKDEQKRKAAAKGTRPITSFFGSNVPTAPRHGDDEKSAPEIEVVREERRVAGKALDDAVAKLELEATRRTNAAKGREVPDGAHAQLRKVIAETIDRERVDAERESRLLHGEIGALEHELDRIQADYDNAMAKRKAAKKDASVIFGDKEKRDLQRINDARQKTKERLQTLRERRGALPTASVDVQRDHTGLVAPFMRLVRQESASGPRVAGSGDGPQKGRLPINLKKHVGQGEPVQFRTQAERRVFASSSPSIVKRRAERMSFQNPPRRRRNVLRRRGAPTSNRVNVDKRRNHTLSNIKRPNFSLIKLSPTQYKIRAVEVNKGVAAQLQTLLKRVPGTSVLVDGIRFARQNAVREALRILIQKGSVIISV